ncbi:large-conductance mechanosensitive channel protein MscL [Nicoliella spurrieriana]|uniref:large-conductance mechanosensitive channel protein MscL n=1 Tax=Nicoliella spurrieriana TaxID=2925830 RepID=UPI0021A630AE|nr:large-conductance mechanosensitive channel protein MscL [Nicoliella spurrieriana]
MFKDFKAFISRGSVIDMAVGIIIGSAFTGIVQSLTKNLINPLIGIFLGKIDLSGIVFTVGKAHFMLGTFLNSIINFLIIAFVVFIIIRVFNKVTNRNTASKPSTTDQLLTDIKGILEKSQPNDDPANATAADAEDSSSENPSNGSAADKSAAANHGTKK